MTNPVKGCKHWRIIAVAFALTMGASNAQSEDTKLYAFSSTPLTIGKGILQNLAPNDPPIQVPVGFYVVKHPKGNILFDTGCSDKLINDPNWWPAGLQSLKPMMTP